MKKKPCKITVTEQRVKDFGEVYTTDNLVKKILDNISDLHKKSNSSFLEPSCGSGNFLVEILEMKINNGFEIIDSLKKIYAVDILEDNVILSRKRLFKKSIDLGLTAADYEKAIDIIKNNIIVGDMLRLDINEAWGNSQV
tara:strand:- start:49 stop:468 length:420 start_codon:yes stop_codon:yes gene_type:complete